MKHDEVASIEDQALFDAFLSTSGNGIKLKKTSKPTCPVRKR